MIVTLSCMFSMVFSQDYVGSANCQVCHADHYTDWSGSGHPFKANIKSQGWNILGAAADGGPQFPSFVSNYRDTWMDTINASWLDDITGVIGGFGWKARFIDNTGKIVGTANSIVNQGLGHNQMNFYGGEEWGWKDYHPSDDKTYNYGCFRCHTTAPTTDGTWLDGVTGLGTFVEDGVGCEACHGPGSDHVSDPNASNIDLVYEFNITDTTGLDFGGTLGVIPPDPNGNSVNYLCGSCHNRGFNAPIEAKGGYIKHHEPWEESLTWDGHSFMSCTTCHEPHKRVVWDGDGVDLTCTESCHSTHLANTNHSSSATCVDCHMPFAGKSAVARGESGFKGDIRSHLFKITVNADPMFTEDGSFVRDDETRPASLDLGFSCLGCHNDDPNDNIPDKTMEEAVASAANMHGTVSTDPYNPVVNQYTLEQNYPNPFNPSTNISFTLPKEDQVQLTIYDVSGKRVNTLAQKSYEAGQHVITWNGFTEIGTLVPAGIYFAEMSTPDFRKTIKMVFMK